MINSEDMLYNDKAVTLRNEMRLIDVYAKKCGQSFFGGVFSGYT
jgi:hypothetical protein